MRQSGDSSIRWREPSHPAHCAHSNWRTTWPGHGGPAVPTCLDDSPPHARAVAHPDFGVTCAAPSLGLMVPEPVLLVEILSPSNEAEIRANIWAYTTIPSVQELLVVHSTRIKAELLRRGADGSWPEQPEIIRADGSLSLASMAFTVPLAAI